MKKVTLLILILVMGLWLFGRGKSDETAPTAVTEAVETHTISDHPLLDSACGEWILERQEDHPYHLYQELTIRNDGTCLVNGEELRWQIDASSKDDELILCFYRGEERVSGAIYYGAFDHIADLGANGMIYPSAFINKAKATEMEMQKADPEAYRTPIVVGQWVLSESCEGVPGEITFREDKRCIIDGAEFAWEYSFTNGNSFGIDVLDGDRVKYELSVPHYNSLEQVMLLYTEDDRGVYINPAHYDIIEITPENWLDYFEIISYSVWTEDAFGDVEKMGGYYYFISLKEEYARLLSSAVAGGDLLTKNAIEVSYNYGLQKCDIQLQEKTYTPIEGTYRFEKNLSCTDKLSYYHRDEGAYEMFVPGYAFSVHDDMIPVLSDFELVRADCPLYLIKEEYRIKP